MSEDGDWSVEDDEISQAFIGQAAESEFKRLKDRLKAKAGLLPLPWYRKLATVILVSIRRFWV